MYRLVLGAAAALLMCAPAIAHAEATSYPARDTLDFPAREVTVQSSSGLRITCSSFDLGAGRIPAEPENHSATSVRVNLSADPTYSGCREGETAVTITTAGTWALEFTWGVPATMNIVVPAEGLRASRVLAGRCTGVSTTAETVRGAFQNGFTSPAFVNSIASFEGAVAMRWSGEILCEAVERLRLTASRVPVRDASNERAVILVGP
jgi:hypothetical protein